MGGNAKTQSKHDFLPLSAPQIGIWLDIIAGRSTADYNLCEVVRFDGPLHVEALTRALAQSHAEADALRMRIVVRDGVPGQIPGPARIDFALLDMSGGDGDAATRETMALEEIDAMCRRPLDLEAGRTSRERLIRLAPDRHWWVRVYHHLVIDGLGTKVQVDRIAQIYNARLRGVEPPATDLGTYGDFIAADATYPGSTEHEADVDYWRKRLDDGGTPTGFSAVSDHRRGRTQALDVPLAPDLVAALRQMAAANGVSLPAIMLAAYLLLLGRCAGTATPACGVPLLNRLGRTERATVGLFTTVVPFGLPLEATEPFAVLARRVARQQRGDFRHMRLAIPHMRVAGLMPWPAGGLRGATFNAINFPNTPLFDGIKTVVESLVAGPVDDVSLRFYDYERRQSRDGTRLVWMFNSAVHDTAGIERLAGRFDVLLKAVAANCQCPLAELPMMGETEAALIAGWENGPSLADTVKNDCVHTRFLAQAARTPNAPAVTAGGRKATYDEIARMAAQVAARLAAEGTEPEEPVGLCLTPSPELVAAFIGILMAGGASLQLDPLQPPGRLQTMIQGVGCRLVLTDAGACNRLPTLSADQQVIAIDDLASQAVGNAAGASATPSITPDQLACIFHTSGSTGRPKPVGLTHGALAAKMASIADVFGFGDEGNECVCAAASVGFDPWLQQVLLPLCTGGRLWIPDRTLMVDLAGFWRAVSEQGTTHLNLVPSMLDSLLPGAPAAGLRGVRRLVLGGERLTPDLVQRTVMALRIDKVWNMYGPTEATVDATGWRLDPAALGEEISIGWPLPGSTIRILDDRLNRVPVGHVGELCIGGVGLARGYLGMPEETAAKFIDDPFGPPGTRLYRSGDRAAWHSDGSVLYRGRVDEQVKVRGQRLELGDVEAALLRQPGVENAVAIFEPTLDGGRLTAHVVGRATPDALRRALALELPAAAVPLGYIFHRTLPSLPSGKVDRQALVREQPTKRAGPAMPARTGLAAASSRRLALQRAIAAVWAELLDGEAPALEANLFEAGVHSLLVPRAQLRLSALAGREVSAVEIFRYPTIAMLAAHLAGSDDAQPDIVPSPARVKAGEDVDDEQAASIAIVGMALRVPGADDPETFWRNLCDGVESIGAVDGAALRAAGQDEGLLADPSFVRAHGRLAGIDAFDPVAFGYTSGEAAAIDPQQRLLLEVALHALENAACEPSRQRPVGAFVGVGFPSYIFDNLDQQLRDGGAERYAVVLGNDKDHAATRLAYKLGLTGPVMAVATACSTGLVAVAQAVQALRAGQCRAALAGGASLGLTSAGGYLFSDGGIGSRSGRCRPFDAEADGTVGGSGGAVVVLKRLRDAQSDGDTIHAVIRGIGLSNDGGAKASFTAPTVDGQAAALAAALADAAVDPGSIGFIEGHGTGTALGDPIEVAALNLAYGPGTPGSILLGSIKGNVGHLDSAAGIAGLIKAAMAVRKGTVPPTCHFVRPNPQIPFAAGPFRVNSCSEPWPAHDGPRRAGVSSFGIGGTNAHVIVEQAPIQTSSMERSGDPAQADVLVLSAADGNALDQLSEAMAKRLDTDDAPALEDVAYSLQTGRRRLRRRRAVIAHDRKEAARNLLGAARIDGESLDSAGSLAFLFPGQGVQSPGMGRALYDQEPVFRAIVDEAATLLADTPAADVCHLLLGDPGDEVAAKRLAGTALTQPALFVTEYGIARVLQAWGIMPDALAGHSVGEYVAACLSGVMPFDSALSLVAERGRLMASAPAGAMLALSVPEAEARALIEELGAGDGTVLSLAAVNGPRQCVAAGSEAAIAALLRLAEAQERPARRLNVSHAFHCALMDPILDSFGQTVANVALAEPAIPFLSNLTGGWITVTEATDPMYWVRHLRGTVRFADNVAALGAEPGRIVIEVGPGSTLSRLARANGTAEADTLATQPTIGGGRPALLEAIARLWVRGVEPDWHAMAGGRPRCRVPLPGYPFQRVRAWVDPQSVAGDASAPATPVRVASPESGNRTAATDAVVAVWREVFGAPEIGHDADFFALGGDSMIALRIVSRLQERLGWTIPVAAILAGRSPAGLVHARDDLQSPSPNNRMETGIL